MTEDVVSSQPRLHLVVYADLVHVANRKRLVASARRLGIAHIHEFSRPDLQHGGFAARNRHILRHSRGGGFCIWKPHVILRVLESAAEGDYVLYCDAGVDLVRDPLPYVEDACRTTDVVLFENQGRKNSTWTKRDTFHYMGADEDRYWNAEQVNAALSIYRNTAAARSFVKEWLAACEDERIVTDAPNVSGVPNLPDFIDHRYDQSVLSILAARHRIPHQTPPLHEGDALPAQDSSTVFLHHRSAGLVLKLIRKWVNLRIRVTKLLQKK